MRFTGSKLYSSYIKKCKSNVLIIRTDVIYKCTILCLLQSFLLAFFLFVLSPVGLFFCSQHPHNVPSFRTNQDCQWPARVTFRPKFMRITVLLSLSFFFLLLSLLIILPSFSLFLVLLHFYNSICLSCCSLFILLIHSFSPLHHFLSLSYLFLWLNSSLRFKLFN